VASLRTVRLFDYRSTINISLLCSSKVSGSTIVAGVHCLVHDVNIHLLTIQFGQLIAGVVVPVNDKAYRKLKAFNASVMHDLQLHSDVVKGLVSK